MADTVAYTITGTDVTTTFIPFVFLRVYHARESFPTGQSDVTITLYDPDDGLSVALDSDACVEGESSGLYMWDSSKLTTQPDGYKEYGYIMDDGVTEKGGILAMQDPSITVKRLEVWRRLALDAANPLTNEPDGGIQATDIDIEATPSGDDIIQTRQ